MSLLVLIGFIVALVVMVKIEGLWKRISALEKKIEELSSIINSSGVTNPDPLAAPKTIPPSPVPVIDEEPLFEFEEISSPGHHPVSSQQTPEEKTPFDRLASQWMVWLGGICVGLAGIFLVHYSVEQGYLGPRARIVLGLLSGLLLHVAAEWWRRRSERHYPSMAALAGGASIILFTVLLASHHLYQLWSPLVVFTGLALVALGTMWLALRQGPILAILGILGAYLVPLLVTTGSQNISGALLYSLIISASAFLLMRWVYRSWLWWGTMSGGLFWLIISLVANNAGSVESLYLPIFGYMMLSLRTGDYLLNQPVERWKGQRFIHGRDSSFLLYHQSLSLLLILLCQCLVIFIRADWQTASWLWLLLVAIILSASRQNRNLDLFPWITLLAYGVTFALAVLMRQELWQMEYYQDENHASFLALIAALVALMSGFSFLQRNKTAAVNPTLSLCWLAPIVGLAVVYSCRPVIHGSLDWFLWTLLLGAIYAALAGVSMRRSDPGVHTAWLLIAAHAAYSMAVVIMFSDATLTLALAVQVVSLVWFGRKFALPHIDLVIKIVLSAILIRLTLNPWLLTYDTLTHWSFWTYGGSCLAIFIAARICRSDGKVRLWLEGATLHLLVLFAATELRYWLYQGKIFSLRYDFIEAAINSVLWGASSLVVYYRATLATATQLIYRWASRILMILSVGGYLLLLTLYSPLMNYQSVGTMPIVNLLLLAYGVPPLIWMAAARLNYEGLAKWFSALAAGSVWFFVTIEIRHFWQGETLLLSHRSVFAGELYSYSLAWLVMAILLFLTGVARANSSYYSGGLLLLGLVIAKIFVVDMNGLQGILRVFSFMGLGLSLLGLAYVHQWFDRRRMPDSAPQPPPPFPGT
ncbi:MAG: DUF2339 domain-containing protein [Pelovirga sp.]